MKPVLYAHPFSSYCQKVLTALYENGTDFDYRILDHNDPETLKDFGPVYERLKLVEDFAIDAVTPGDKVYSRGSQAYAQAGGRLAKG